VEGTEPSVVPQALMGASRLAAKIPRPTGMQSWSVSCAGLRSGPLEEPAIDKSPALPQMSDYHFSR